MLVPESSFSLPLSCSSSIPEMSKASILLGSKSKSVSASSADVASVGSADDITLPKYLTNDLFSSLSNSFSSSSSIKRSLKTLCDSWINNYIISAAVATFYGFTLKTPPVTRATSRRLNV